MTPFLANLRVLLLALAAALMPAAVLAQDYPARPAGPVYDGADILSPETEAALDQRLRAYNQETGRAIIVATVPGIDGAPIEPYATGLFSEWGIGGAARDQGLLLLIARDDRRLRIEVGYGLHPYFGGIMSGRVINDVITPRFKAGDFDGGVTAGIDAIIEHLARSPADAAAVAEAAEAAAAQESAEGGFPIGALFWVAILFFFFILPMIRGGKRRRYRSGVGGVVGDIILWEAGKAIIGSMSDGDSGGWGGGGGFGGGGGGGFGGFGGGMSGGGGASGGW
ncbi:TPM domain-containing protein [Altererythrobacter sp. H2]|uniref:TPM domain-containing protein n=1 Tax=Altererythrobacter sp. H2 TaxID=3108391 RepID=UPI002B4C1578|nr:TPM domain-containing protein [Altererythrobacter sp. H2]WRK97222.1 TPM domain-containing protein [Altererythrobacter sp. H2]